VKKVLITGSSGQVGSRLIKRFSSPEFDVYTITSNHSKVELPIPHTSIHLNLLEDDVNPIIQEIAPELLIHLAWETSPITFWDSPKNEEWLQASKRLIESFSKEGGSKIVVSGTCAEYDWRNVTPLRETDPEFPQSAYGKAKLGLLNFLRKQSTPYLWTRTFFQFGGNEPAGRLVSSAIDALATGNEFLIRKPEDIRDYIYIDDVVRIIASLVLADEEGIFNVASGRGISMRELGGVIASELGCEKLMKFQNQLENPSIVVANTAKLEKALGVLRGASLVDAIRKTIEVRGTR
jgi:nucleoside-diphosphate-sugar epimerase